MRRSQLDRYLAAEKEYTTTKQGTKRSKQLQRHYANEMALYICLVVWTAVPPVRSQVLRKAIMSEPPKNPDPKAVYVWYDDSKQRYIFKYGKLKCGGRQLPLPVSVNDQLHKYMNEARPLLDIIDNKSHLFVGRSAGKPMFESGFSSWIKGMFTSHGVNTTAHILRHSKVTHKIESGASAVEMVAMSKVMEQTVQTQQDTYNRMSLTPSA